MRVLVAEQPHSRRQASEAPDVTFPERQRNAAASTARTDCCGRGRRRHAPPGASGARQEAEGASRGGSPPQRGHRRPSTATALEPLATAALRCVVFRREPGDELCQVEPVSRKHSAGKHGPGRTGRLPGASASREPGHLHSARQPHGRVSGSERMTPPTRVIGAGRRGPRPRPSCRPPTPARPVRREALRDGREAGAAFAHVRTCVWHTPTVARAGLAPSEAKTPPRPPAGEGAPQLTPASPPAPSSPEVCQGLKTEFTFAKTDVIYSP